MDEQARWNDSLYEEHSRAMRREKEKTVSHKPDISVIIVDDQELVRSGFRMILSAFPHISIVGEAQNGREGVSLVQKSHPDVVLMDIRMPIIDGIEATKEICSNPDTATSHVLILTTFDIDEYIYDALAAGASGFLLKDSEPKDIVSAIEVVSRGDALIQPSITKRLIETFVSSRPKSMVHKIELGGLTERETEILKQVAGGLSNQEIAEALVISPATVKTHLARIMAKTDAHDRAQLVVLAYENGLVSPKA